MTAELREALTRISQIHSQVAMAEAFRGYRSLPMALTGLLAIAGMGVAELASAVTTTQGFVSYWVGIAALALALCSLDLVLRGFARGDGQPGARRRSLAALAQLLPMLATGALVTWLLLRIDPRLTPILPGLWCFLFALGVFASRPYLPRAVGWVGLWYLLAGCVLLDRAVLGTVPDSIGMGVAFGIGQLGLATVLHWNLERDHVC